MTVLFTRLRREWRFRLAYHHFVRAGRAGSFRTHWGNGHSVAEALDFAACDRRHARRTFEKDWT